MKAFIDFETTGLDPLSEPLTLGMLLTNEDLDIISEHEIKFRPTGWSEEAEKIHGISRTTALNFPDPKEGLAKIKEIVPENTTIICHSNPNMFLNNKYLGSYYFDVGVMKILFERHELYHEYFKHFVKSESTHAMARDYFKGIVDRPRKLSLDSLCDYFGIELKHHNAMSDVWACYKLYKIMQQQQSHMGGLLFNMEA